MSRFSKRTHRFICLAISFAILCLLASCGMYDFSTEVGKSTPRVTKDEIASSYATIEYKDVLRNPSKFTGTYVVLTVQIKQILSQSDATYFRAYTDDSGHGWYLDDEWIVIDKRVDDSTKILSDDIIVVYGVLHGTQEITRSFTKTTDELPVLVMLYMDLLEEDDVPPVPGSNSGIPVSDGATTGQANALKSAKSYLSYTSFSYSSLVKQLEFEGYTTEEATYAADNCGADWYEQAALKAKEYLEFSSFSRQQLINQLLFEGFTEEEVEYGVTESGY